MPENLAPEELLIAAVVALALKEDGADYLRDPCGQWWLGLVGVTGSAAWRAAGHYDTYAPRDHCVRRLG